MQNDPAMTNAQWATRMNLQHAGLPKPILVFDAEGNRWRFAVQWEEEKGDIRRRIYVSRNGEYYPSSDVGAFVLLCNLVDAQQPLNA